MSTSTYKLFYFDAMARAELIRLIFQAVGQKFEDVRIKDWPKGKEDSPTGSVPYIIVDGQTKVAQSMAIARFVAKRFGLSGKNDLDDLKIDSLVDCLHDLTEIFRGNPREIYLISIFTPEQRERAVARLAELGDKHLSTLEKLIGMYSRAKGYTVGDYLTWADIYLYDTMFYILKVNPKALDAYPHVSAVKKNVEAHPKIGAYLKSRPPTAKP